MTRKVNDISDITDIDSIAKDFISIIMSLRNLCIINLLLTASYEEIYYFHWAFAISWWPCMKGWPKAWAPAAKKRFGLFKP